MPSLKYITAPVLALTFVLTFAFAGAPVSAQSGQNCSTPDFQITSDSQIYALTGDSFSYYVVTENDTDFSLQSSLPAGLNYSNGQISGTPQTPGDYNLQFVASNSCGSTSQSLTLSVVSSSGAAGGVAQADPTAGQGAAAGSGGQQVGLNEIPETGVGADSLLTVLFYALALLALVGWAGKRFRFASVGSSSTNRQPDFDSPSYTLANPDRDQKPRRFGDGMKRR